MTWNVKVLRPVVAAVGAALALTACSSTPAEQLSSGEGYSVLGALAEIPASAVYPDTPVIITSADLVGTAEVSGVEVPTTQEELREFQLRVTGSKPADDVPTPMFVSYPEWLIAYQRGDDVDLGFSALEVSSFVDLMTPPSQFTAVSGGWGEEDPMSALPEIGEGVFTFGEGEDFTLQPDQVSQVSPTGTPLRLATQDDRIAVTRSTSAASDWISGDFESLADDEELAAVAAALDEAGALSSFIHQTDRPNTVPEAEYIPQGPITTTAIGWTVEDGVSRIALVYHFHSAEAAEAALPVFERQYSDDVPLHTGQPLAERLRLVGVESHDQVAVVTVQPTDKGRPSDVITMLMSRDVPFQQYG